MLPVSQKWLFQDLRFWSLILAVLDGVLLLFRSSHRNLSLKDRFSTLFRNHQYGQLQSAEIYFDWCFILTHHWRNSITKLMLVCNRVLFSWRSKVQHSKDGNCTQLTSSANDQLVGKTLFSAFSVMWVQRKYKWLRSFYYILA